MSPFSVIVSARSVVHVAPTMLPRAPMLPREERGQAPASEEHTRRRVCVTLFKTDLGFAYICVRSLRGPKLGGESNKLGGILYRADESENRRHITENFGTH